MRAIKSILLCVFGMLLCNPAWSTDALQTLPQLNHTSWKVLDGAPPDIRAAAQTEDGTLWLGGPSGLYWFDGMRFVRYTGPPGQPFNSHNIFTLAAWPGEGLWIGFSLGGIAVLKDNRVSQFDERDGLPGGGVLRILKDQDGSFWALTSGGLAHLRGTRWQRAPLDSDGPLASGSAIIDSSGTVWVASGRAPAFTQKTASYTLYAFVFLSAVYVLCRIRTRQVAAQVRARLEARVAERERIARELHDTLLQGVQGLIWRFQAVANRISQPEPVRAMMERALDRADQMLGEARDRVKELRATGGEEVDLSRALATEGEQLVILHPAHFQTRVVGTPRELQPIVSEEIMFIAREALRNAIQHSGAQRIDAEVSYSDSALHVIIRDDGEGICEETLNGGKPGHFGLLGMRERAEKIRAQVKISSKPGVGTEIELRVPAAVAYRRPQTRFRWIRTALARWQCL